MYCNPTKPLEKREFFSCILLTGMLIYSVLSGAAVSCVPAKAYLNDQEVKIMPNIKSAMKRVKVSKKKNLRNRMIKSGVKTAVKKYEAALTQEQLSNASAALDKAASKGVIHKNAANRKKARLARKLNAAK